MQESIAVLCPVIGVNGFVKPGGCLARLVSFSPTLAPAENLKGKLLFESDREAAVFFRKDDGVPMRCIGSGSFRNSLLPIKPCMVQTGMKQSRDSFEISCG